VNRLEGELGFCKSGKDIQVSSIGLHFGEEPFISGKKGSGTIFFTYCTLRCRYCQNYQIGQEGVGKTISIEDLADEMVSLQHQGAHNINLVTPTHFVPQIIEALKIAIKNGLTIPIVYNTSGYETLEALEALDGLIQIYLPDIKYSENEMAIRYSSAHRYVETNRAAVFEMFRQVGNLEIKNGVAKKGLLVRHLVLPNKIAGSFASFDFIASLSREIWLSLMAQYHPCSLAKDDPLLNRKLKTEEYQEVIDYAHKLGLRNLLTQELDSSEIYLPDFNQEKPFA
jgi:putative pyruvate formate lyase activating enzyme